MATVSTTYGTYLEDLFNPQVIADLINAKLIDKIAFAPLATIDTTLQGHAGDTVTLPYYAYIGAAEEDVAEGTDIPIAKLTTGCRIGYHFSFPRTAGCSCGRNICINCNNNTTLYGHAQSFHTPAIQNRNSCQAHGSAVRA